MSGDTTNLMKSKIAYSICSELMKGQPEYGRKLAERMDKKSESEVESIRNRLREMDDKILNSKKDGRKREYNVDVDKIYEFWMEEISCRVEKAASNSEIEVDIRNEEALRKEKQAYEDTADTFEEKDDLEMHGKVHQDLTILEYAIWLHDIGGRLKYFFRTYADVYLKLKEESTFEKMLFQDLAAGLSSYKGEDFRRDTELETLREILVYVSGNPIGLEAASIAAEKTLSHTST